MVQHAQKTPRIFYGWFVVIACFAATSTLGEAMWSFGVFFKPLETEFGWSRALVSSAYTAFVFGFAISVIIAGRLSDRHSPRPILFVSALLAGIGLALCSRIEGINELRFFLFIGGLGGGATISVPTSVVQRWFYGKAHAGLALGIVMAGVGVGAIILTPLINYLIIYYGWRTTYLIVGSIFFISIFFASLVIRPAPRQDRGTASTRTTARGYRLVERGLTTGDILRSPSFMGIMFIQCSVVCAFAVVAVHIVPYATDYGISPTTAAVALGMMGAFSVPGRMIAGYIADKIGWKKILAVAVSGMALFVLWLFFLRGPLVLFCFVFFYGFCHGARVASHLGVLGEFFGMKSLGEIIGITMAMSQLLGAFAPYIAGFIFDVTGSYVIAFALVMVLLTISGIVALLIRSPMPAEQ